MVVVVVDIWQELVMRRGASYAISTEQRAISVRVYPCCVVPQRSKPRHRDVKSLGQYHTTKTPPVTRLECLVYP